MKQLLKIFREHGPMTSRQAFEKMESDDWCFNTVRIYCARARVSGNLRRVGKGKKKSGAHYVYEITEKGMAQIETEPTQHKPTRNFGEEVVDVVKEAITRKVPNSIWSLV